jgi:hypothetical protein
MPSVYFAEILGFATLGPIRAWRAVEPPGSVHPWRHCRLIREYVLVKFAGCLITQAAQPFYSLTSADKFAPV